MRIHTPVNRIGWVVGYVEHPREIINKKATLLLVSLFFMGSVNKLSRFIFYYWSFAFLMMYKIQ